MIYPIINRIFRPSPVFFIFIINILTSCKSGDTVMKVTIQINGSDVFYSTIGQGPPIIIIHGGPVLDHTYLLTQMDELADNYRLIDYDQRACGKSSVEVDTSTMTLKRFADDIRILADSLGIKKPNILGHSWGGLIAIKYAISYPHHINKLILSNSKLPDVHE
jgi:proline iminopeptidase